MKTVQMRKRKQEAEVEKLFKKVVIDETSHSSSVSSESSVSEEDFHSCCSPAKSPRKRRASKNTMTPALTTTWDRENLSCHQAAASYVAAASSLGHFVLEISSSAFMSCACWKHIRLLTRSSLSPLIRLRPTVA